MTSRIAELTNSVESLVRKNGELEAEVERLCRDNSMLMSIEPDQDRNGKLYGAFVDDPATPESLWDLEPMICDALAQGCVRASPGDGVGCVANMIWAALQRAEAAEARETALRAAQEPDREPLAEGREHLTASGKFRSDKFPIPDNFVAVKLMGRCRDLIGQIADRYGGEFGRDLKDALATKEADDAD